MLVHRLNKGLDLPLAGAPEQRIDGAPVCRRAALVVADYPGLKPRLLVGEGDIVKRGQAIFVDRRGSRVRYTSPESGTVESIHRGQRRALRSVVIRIQGDAQVDLRSTTTSSGSKSREGVIALLCMSGLWTALRTRPFGRVPDPEMPSPHSVFVNAMDSHPHAPNMDVVAAGREQDLKRGLELVAALTSGRTFLCVRKGSSLTAIAPPEVTTAVFDGPHPAGTVGAHIHFLDPVHREKTVWYVGMQDVIALGVLAGTGRIDNKRVVSVAGPLVSRPRLVRTFVGASIDELLRGEVEAGDQRVVSGSALCGRSLTGEADGFLGRYHQQVSVLSEGRDRAFLGWSMPGTDRFSAVRVFLSALFRKRTFELTTNLHGSSRAIMPIGVYERVMPLDIPATFLLRALASGDLDRAEDLGCLELEEEDLALCTFVCPGKGDYGKHLRETLDALAEEVLCAP